MPAIQTRLDSLREYLTGASSDGAAQSNQAASFGNFRSSTEVQNFGITVTSPISGITVAYASGGNAEGAGTLNAVDADTVAWKDFGTSVYGSAQSIANGQSMIVESSSSPGAFLRITRTSASPLTGTATVTLAKVVDNAYTGSDINPTQATSGVTTYRGTILRNESISTVTGFVRFIGLLGTQQTTNSGQLGASGSGTITITGTFADWPLSGYAQIRNSGGTLKEVIYYSSRTNTVLTVPSTGRALAGSSATAGANTDIAWPVPNVAVALDTAGVQAGGSSIQTIANETTAPTSVTWNLEITESTGISVATILAGQQIGIWMKHFYPANTQSLPTVQMLMQDTFNAP